MEKNNEAKNVKMEAAASKQKSDGTTDGQGQKLTYEQLSHACGELVKQNQQYQQVCQQLQKQNQELAGMLQSKRLDYLLKVVEITGASYGKYATFDDAFLGTCIDEIQEMLAPNRAEAPAESNDNEG